MAGFLIGPCGVAPAASPVTFNGPGDSQTFIIWGSSARAYSATVAALGALVSVLDLVDQAGSNPITIKLAATTGLVDVAAINAWVAANSVTTIKVAKLYDQVGTNHWVQATLAKMPSLVVSGINGLPSMSFTAASSQTLITGGNITQAIPFSLEGVAERTGTIAAAQILSNKAVDIEFNFNAADTAAIYAGAGTGLNATALDNAPHVIQGTYNTGTTGTINVDGGTQQVGTSGTNIFNGHQMCIGSYQDSLQYLNGLVSEVGMYAGTFSSGVQSNARTAYGL